jgi:3-oxoacyl-[acyl-carrier-protein] synthase-3
VLGCGSYLPQKVLTNAELAARIDTSDEWICSAWHPAAPRSRPTTEFTSHLGINAARCTG